MTSPGSARLARPVRRAAGLVLAAVGLAVALAPAGALAQEPSPRVTITGFVDTVASWARNLSAVDLDYAAAGDTEWYVRNRLRPDVTAEVGATRLVLGLEIDYLVGRTGATDAIGPRRTGSTAGAELDIDMHPVVELKWGYVELDVPAVPFATRVRLGAQPYTATLKPGVLATGDFGGAHVSARLAPDAWLNLALAHVEETGKRGGFFRGDDLALITSWEITPAKTLALRPLYALFVAAGVTSDAARQGRGGLGTGAASFHASGTEWRHTVGFDVRWRAGAFSIEPTLLFQWGTREVTAGDPFTALGTRPQDRRAWLADLRGGWRSGPLLVEAAAIYSTGNRAGEDVRSPRRTIRYFEPIDAGTSFCVGWAEILAKGVEDDLNVLYSTAAGLNPGMGPSFDKYGTVRAGSRASYALAPAFLVRGALTALWTAEAVDTSSTLAAATGLTPGDFRGDSRHLGTELDLGFQWRLAPGLALDVVTAWLWAGRALGQATATSGGTGAVRRAREPQDVRTTVARLRYTF